MPVATSPGPNTTTTVEPWSAFAVVVPTHATLAAPATTAAQGKPCSPAVVENTAIGTVPGATAAGTVAVSVQAVLPTTRPVPFTAPLTATCSTGESALGTPARPVAPKVACTWAMACARLSEAGVPVGVAVLGRNGVVLGIWVLVAVAVSAGVGVRVAVLVAVAEAVAVLVGGALGSASATPRPARKRRCRSAGLPVAGSPAGRW
jgi:hypothetical protein